ncbi:MAG: aminotransferase class III-fold pyridoxal phosphate-dependent enzyme, partial [Chloroflexi bacterium]
GRTGAWFAAQKLGVTPDIMALAKALGGGLPLGAVVAPRELQEKWLTGTHGSTFGGNPVSCASGLATLEVIRDEDLITRAERLGELMVRELAPLRSHPRVREVRRIGAMVAVEFTDAKASKAVLKTALDADVLLITCGFHDQVVRFIPPLNISESDLHIGTRVVVEAVLGKPVATPA